MLVFHFIQRDVCCDLMHYLVRLVLPSVHDLPPPWKPSALTRTRFTRFQIYSTNLPVVIPLLSLSFCCRLGCGPLKEHGPQVISYSSYVFIHMHLVQAPCFGTSALLKVREIKVNWEPWPAPKHQIVWAVPHHSGSGGIIGIHYFSQMTWPVSFFIFSQLPNHLHNSLIGPLYQPIHLGDGRAWFDSILHTEKFTHLTNDVAHEVHTMIT